MEYPTFFEHMCFKGTTKRPKAIDISWELDSVGAQYNAFLRGNTRVIMPKPITSISRCCLMSLSDIYLNPVFNEKEIEKEKGVIIEEITCMRTCPIGKFK